MAKNEKTRIEGFWAIAEVSDGNDSKVDFIRIEIYDYTNDKKGIIRPPHTIDLPLSEAKKLAEDILKRAK